MQNRNSRAAPRPPRSLARPSVPAGRILLSGGSVFLVLTLIVIPSFAGPDRALPGGPGRLAQAQDPPPRPAPRAGRSDDTPDQSRKDYSADCMASGCHAGLRKSPWVHSPVSVGACDTCHVLTGKAEEHRFTDGPPETGTCRFCHQIQPNVAGAHDVFVDQDCTICHDPHGGANSILLRSQESSDLCGHCHVRIPPGETEAPAADPDASPTEHRKPIQDFTHRHEPFGKNLCLDCHNAHHSDHSHLLKGVERDLCLGCHEPVSEALAAAEFVHKPVLEECHDCHHPHGGEDARLLKSRTHDLCIGCHEEVQQAIDAEGMHAHGAMEEGDSCLSCHLGHLGTTKELLREPMRDSCIGCHAEAITTADGREIAGVAEQLAMPVLHGPFEDGTCLECHRPHASENPDLLNAPIPSRIYVRYSDDAYSFCYQCHDPRMITDERSTLSSFRDGDRNLHFVHVKRDKSRTCGICHDVHASHTPALLKDSVQYGPGGWSLAIDFRETPEGGTCFAGCHQEMTYDNRVPAGVEGAHLLEKSGPSPEKKD